MNRMTHFRAIATLALASCSTPQGETASADAELRGTVTVNGLALEYFDWGGSGMPLVMLAGAGDTPLQFLGMVRELRTQHRVIGLTRRGHGGSEGDSARVSLDVLVDDVRAALDSLRITRAVLLGMSFGGQEITRFAERFPERVAGLIYLDAILGINDSTTAMAAMAALPPGIIDITPEDRSSLERFVAYHRRVEFAEVEWTPDMERHVRALARVDSAGRPTELAPGLGSSLLAINFSYRRNWKAVRAPVLAFVGSRYLPPAAAPDSVTLALLDRHQEKYLTPLREAELALLTATHPSARIVRLTAISHSGIIARPPANVPTEILAFTRTL